MNTQNQDFGLGLALQMFAAATDDAADIFDWSTMTPGYFETAVGPRMVVTDTLILICDKWQKASEQEKKELFYTAGLVHLHRVAALEIPGEVGEKALEAIDSLEGWPAEPILERSRKIISDSRTVVLAQLSTDMLPTRDRAALTAYRDVLSLRRRFKADDERRWNWRWHTHPIDAHWLNRWRQAN